MTDFKKDEYLDILQAFAENHETVGESLDAIHSEFGTNHCDWCHAPLSLENIGPIMSGAGRCTGCSRVPYCSKTCQKKAWNEGSHKSECPQMNTQWSKACVCKKKGKGDPSCVCKTFSRRLAHSQSRMDAEWDLYEKDALGRVVGLFI